MVRFWESINLWQRIIFVVFITFGIVGITIPSTLYLKQRADNAEQEELQRVLNGFNQNYGSESQVLLIQPPKVQYEIVWQDNTYRYISLYMDGIFIKVAQVPISGSISSP